MFICSLRPKAIVKKLLFLAVIVAAISVSLGFMNLLPIPPFDGGKILIELIPAGK